MDTPEDTIDEPTEEPRKSEWPDKALHETASGDIVEPGDPGYDAGAVSARLRKELKELENSAEDTRKLIARVQKFGRKTLSRVEATQAMRASMQAERDRLASLDQRKIELKETLKDMGLLD